MIGSARGDPWLRLGLMATLAVIVVHALFYRFLCDDAFISFRYAHNLAAGQGLVFNPGFERVEGYSNFLWVAVLAGFDALGAQPEHVAPVLSVLLTVVLWGLVARASLRWIPVGTSRFVILLPTAWLALTRSVAVWSTSGLETRLFEALVVAGVLRLLDDVAIVSERNETRAPWGAALLALATLTRPDGMLIAGGAMSAAAAVLASRRRLRLRDVTAHAVVFGGIVGAHLVFRHAYYGDWVPNTYYAKVGGRTWWGMGLAYLSCFAIEYAAWLWIPLVVAGVRGFSKDSRVEIPLLAAAVVLPHALYVASIGGDHFEFRPLDLYFPFAFLLMGRGAAALAADVLPRSGVALYAAVVSLGLVAIPWQSHRQFPTEYSGGFPGLGGAKRKDQAGFLDPSRDPVYRWPGLRQLALAHRSLLRQLTSRLVGVRQEEHALFLRSVVPDGRRLHALVATGVIPRDTHIAISAVGAIPYYSGVRVLDRLGLTDRVVAKQAPGDLRILAHDRHATIDYAAVSGVDLWSEHPVHLLMPVDDDNLVFGLEGARASGAPVYFADTGDGEYLVAQLPQGIARTAERFPKLAFHVATDADAYAALLDAVIAAHRRALSDHPSAHESRVSLGSALAARGLDEEAMSIFRGLADENDADGWYNLGTLLARRGAYGEAADALRHALAVDPSMGLARHNLGLALARSGRLGEAIVEFREVARLDPESEEAVYTLGVALLAAGDSNGAADCIQALERLGTVQGNRLARRLAENGAGQKSK